MNRDHVVFAACGFILGLVVGSFLIGPKLAHTRLAGNASAFAAESETPAVMAGGAAPASDAMPVDGNSQMAGVRQRLQSLKDRVAQNPKDADAMVQLATMYMEVGRYPQAIDYYKQALTAGDNPDLHTDLGIAYKQAGQLDNAFAEFSRVAKEHPGEWEPAYNLAIVLAEMRRTDEARVQLAKLQQMRPNDPDVQRLAAAIAEK